MQIHIKKGHNLRIRGMPERVISTGPPMPFIGLTPSEFLWAKLKCLVSKGDEVRVGSPLLAYKAIPEIRFAAPAAGIIENIVYGERRSIQKIIIRVAEREDYETVDTSPPEALTRTEVITAILKANLWTMIRQRPFGKVANPGQTPKAIFISGLNTAPLSVDLEMVLQDQQSAFHTGLQVLSKLTPGPVHLTVSGQSQAAVFTTARKVELHRISGPHPAGNVGIQIHHIDPLNPGEVVWTVRAQQVVTLGKLFLTGRFDPMVFITVGGPAVVKPAHIKTRMGAHLGTLLADNIQDVPHRIISGDVLTGRRTDSESFLGFYDTTVAVVPVDHRRSFLGWIRPGTSRNAYSLTRSFLGFGKPEYAFSTRKNGGLRAPVPINAWENVLPMNILPVQLYHSILAEDIEEMEKLGILECDPEDFALCSFACPSKIELNRVIQRGLELMEREG